VLGFVWKCEKLAAGIGVGGGWWHWQEVLGFVKMCGIVGVYGLLWLV